MTVYAGRPVQYLATFFATLSLFLTVCFWVFMDIVGFRNQIFDYSLGIVLVLLTLSLLITAFNYWRHPTLMIDQEHIHVQSFPFGHNKIPRQALKGVKQSWLGLSPMIEIEYEQNGGLRRIVIAAEGRKQQEILKQIGN